MASSYVGIFIPSLKDEVRNSLKELWADVNPKDMRDLFQGIAVFDLSIKYENPLDFDEFKKDNLELVQKLILLGEKHPSEPIVFIEEYEHGDINSYQGFVYKAKELKLNEMGNFNFVFNKFKKEFEEQKTNWREFYENRLNSLTSFLGIEESDVNLFESCYKQ